MQLVQPGKVQIDEANYVVDPGDPPSFHLDADPAEPPMADSSDGGIRGAGLR